MAADLTTLLAARAGELIENPVTGKRAVVRPRAHPGGAPSPHPGVAAQPARPGARRAPTGRHGPTRPR
jgi:hypothetical protein